MIQEEAFVTKQRFATEKVSVRSSVAEEMVTVRDTVQRDAVEVRRVPIGREVKEAPPIREEGDVTVIPVVEERLVVEKRLFLVEEVHLVRRRSIEQVEMPVTLRRTIVEVDRTTPENTQVKDV